MAAFPVDKHRCLGQWQWQRHLSTTLPFFSLNFSRTITPGLPLGQVHLIQYGVIRRTAPLGSVSISLCGLKPRGAFASARAIFVNLPFRGDVGHQSGPGSDFLFLRPFLPFRGEVRHQSGPGSDSFFFIWQYLQKAALFHYHKFLAKKSRWMDNRPSYHVA